LKVYTKVFKTSGREAWVQRSSGLIDVESRTSAFTGIFLVKGRECGIEANLIINLKLLLNIMACAPMTVF
jgi:hypothetical protein